MRTLCCLALVSLCVCAPGSGVVRADKDHDEVTLRATLRGANEVPPINTAATGRFAATIHEDGTIDFTLTFANLSSNAIVSHIHFGQPNVAGGVMIFLCGGGNQPACPAAKSGTITGTISPANVTGPAGQGVTVGDLASGLRIIANGEGYANLHTTMFPGGEIRGQVRTRGEDN
jgi:hypothetical protein